jgi:hypothetical protein
MPCGSDQEAIVRFTKVHIPAAAMAFFFVAPPTYAQVEAVSPGARLSAALGGSLGDGMLAAGSMGHGSVNSIVEPRLGRSEAFRRRVALDAQLAASTKGQSEECATQVVAPPTTCSLVASISLQTSVPNQGLAAEHSRAGSQPAQSATIR